MTKSQRARKPQQPARWQPEGEPRVTRTPAAWLGVEEGSNSFSSTTANAAAPDDPPAPALVQDNDAAQNAIDGPVQGTVPDWGSWTYPPMPTGSAQPPGGGSGPSGQTGGTGGVSVNTRMVSIPGWGSWPVQEEQEQ